MAIRNDGTDGRGHHTDFDGPGVVPPFEPSSLADGAEKQDRTDKIVFGISAALVIGFLAWGTTSASSSSADASAC